MSKAEIMAEIPRLSHTERREIMRLIFESEQDVDTLAECDRLALERFRMLDARLGALTADELRQIKSALVHLLQLQV